MNIPSLQDFINATPESLHPWTQDKVVFFFPDGSTRWYFVEHGDIQHGYQANDLFQDYAIKTLHRTLEIINMMFNDGIQTVIFLVLVPSQIRRGPAYELNTVNALNLMIDQNTQNLCNQYNIGSLFRGQWRSYLETLHLEHLLAEFSKIEAQTTPTTNRWLYWFIPDDPIPASLTTIITESISTRGILPSQQDLISAYYGRSLTQVDIFIGHNKPSLQEQLTPLLKISDLYFTATPSYYLGHTQWRHILYDHLFERREPFQGRDTLSPDTIADLRQFYAEHQNTILGIGAYDEPSKTWRPTFP